MKIEWQACPGSPFYKDCDGFWISIAKITMQDLEKVGIKFIVRIDDKVYDTNNSELQHLISKEVFWNKLND